MPEPVLALIARGLFPPVKVPLAFTERAVGLVQSSV